MLSTVHYLHIIHVRILNLNFCLQGLTTAFVYNAGMYSISEKVNMEIVYPLLIAAPQILLYAAILLRVGVSVT